MSEPIGGYYKVRSGNTSGYISGSWLKEEINTTDNHQGEDEKKSYISFIPKNILGFYLVERIEEYTLNSITGEKKL